MLNHLIIIAKYYMFCAFVEEEMYYFAEFVNIASHKYAIEKHIAIKRKEYDIFFKKWSRLASTLDHDVL